jgi:LMBR1 domain-containing protein 1
VKTWTKIEAIFRPLKLIGGLLLMIVALLIWTSMLITGIDKAKNSVCKAGCGYLLGHSKSRNLTNSALLTQIHSQHFPTPELDLRGVFQSLPD